MARKARRSALGIFALGSLAKGFQDARDREDDFNKKLGMMLVQSQMKKLSDTYDTERQKDSLRLKLMEQMQDREILGPDGRVVGRVKGMSQETIEQQFPGYLKPKAPPPAPGAPILPPVPALKVGAKSSAFVPSSGGADKGKVSALVQGGLQSVQRVKDLKVINPNIVTEFKFIRNDPTGLYEQTKASPEAKEAIANLRIGIANQLYLKTGAASTEGEVNENLRNYLAQIADKDGDFDMRIDLLGREIGNYGELKNQTSSPQVDFIKQMESQGFKFKGVR